MSVEHPVQPTHRLGRYEIIQALGVGSYARVFAAYDTELDRHVALEVYQAPHARMEIESEARALARVDHPNVIKLHEMAEADGLGFLVLEFVSSWTLHDYINGWHDWRDVVGVFIGGHSSAAADQFGFCLMLWEALYAVRPWSMSSAELVLVDARRREVRRPVVVLTIAGALLILALALLFTRWI